MCEKKGTCSRRVFGLGLQANVIVVRVVRLTSDVCRAYLAANTKHIECDTSNAKRGRQKCLNATDCCCFLALLLPSPPSDRQTIWNKLGICCSSNSAMVAMCWWYGTLAIYACMQFVIFRLQFDVIIACSTHSCSVYRKILDGVNSYMHPILRPSCKHKTRSTATCMNENIAIILVQLI